MEQVIEEHDAVLRELVDQGKYATVEEADRAIKEEYENERRKEVWAKHGMTLEDFEARCWAGWPSKWPI